MAILRPAILFAVIILFAGTGSQVAFGDFHAPARMSVIVALPGATAEAGENSELVESFLGLMGNLRKARSSPSSTLPFPAGRWDRRGPASPSSECSGTMSSPA